MKRGIALAMAALLTLAIVGPAAAGAGDAAVGGGWRLADDGTRVATWALSARSGPSGEDAGGRYFFSRPDVGLSLWGEVTCLHVEGSYAVAAGRITRSIGLVDQVGFIVVLFDGGRSAPDQVSGTGIVPNDAPEAWLDTCPTFDPADFGNFWRDNQGSVRIVNR
jgi:hypothetical protein